MDDILLIGNDVMMLKETKESLERSFSMKDFGEATYILGIMIYRDRSRWLIGLSQSTYVDKVLKKFNMESSKKGFLPMSHGIKLSKTQCPSTTDERCRMSVIPYASVVGSIMYAMICTRPDVSYALSVTSRYHADPGETHWTTVKTILKYLRRTKDMFLVYGGEDELSVRCYTDASYLTDSDDSRSQSGYVFVMNGGAVSWKSSSKIQCRHPQQRLSILLPRRQQRKHILMRYHLIRQVVKQGDIKLCKVHTDANVADLLTKALPQPKHEAHI